jgi:elongation factor 1-beta
MPATVAVKIKIMPESPDTDLSKIKHEGKQKIESEKAVLHSFEEQLIAFGLKALIATIAWPESKDTSIIEELFKSIHGVSQADIIDYRRAIG